MFCCNSVIWQLRVGRSDKQLQLAPGEELSCPWVDRCVLCKPHLFSYSSLQANTCLDLSWATLWYIWLIFLLLYSFVFLLVQSQNVVPWHCQNLEVMYGKNFLCRNRSAWQICWFEFCKTRWLIIRSYNFQIILKILLSYLSSQIDYWNICQGLPWMRNHRNVYVYN